MLGDLDQRPPAVLVGGQARDRRDRQTAGQAVLDEPRYAELAIHEAVLVCEEVLKPAFGGQAQVVQAFNTAFGDAQARQNERLAELLGKQSTAVVGQLQHLGNQLGELTNTLSSSLRDAIDGARTDLADEQREKLRQQNENLAQITNQYATLVGVFADHQARIHVTTEALSSAASEIHATSQSLQATGSSAIETWTSSAVGFDLRTNTALGALDARLAHHRLPRRTRLVLRSTAESNRGKRRTAQTTEIGGALACELKAPARYRRTVFRETPIVLATACRALPR